MGGFGEHVDGPVAGRFVVNEPERRDEPAVLHCKEEAGSAGIRKLQRKPDDPRFSG